MSKEKTNTGTFNDGQRGQSGSVQKGQSGSTQSNQATTTFVPTQSAVKPKS
jgi:hypothetical protein